MKQLWAPWRMEYLRSTAKPDGCLFCAIGAQQDGAEGLDLVVWRGEKVYALLNRYPYANAHVMVVPYEHVRDLDSLDEPVLTELMVTVARLIRALRQVYEPEGFNIGANLGKAAGAGIGDHLHVHVVPRWTADTNFMTTTAGTRVIPEALSASARAIRAVLASSSSPEGAER